MTAIKERILGAISVMSDSDAEDVWAYIITRFPSRSWDEIEETVPDEWDRAMLQISDVQASKRNIMNAIEAGIFTQSTKADFRLELTSTFINSVYVDEKKVVIVYNYCDDNHSTAMRPNVCSDTFVKMKHGGFEPPTT